MKIQASMSTCPRRRALWLPLALAAPMLVRSQQRPDFTAPPDVRLPSGKLQRDEILKAEHEQNLKEAAELVELAQQFQADIEKNDRFVLSLNTLKKADDIEKLVKKIRSRLRHN
jgi:cell division septation protein DedD